MAYPIVQMTQIASGSETGVLTFTSNITPGNTVIVCQTSANSSVVTPTPGSGGDTYLLAVSPVTEITTAIFYVLSSSGGYNTITISNGEGTGEVVGYAFEINTCTALDKTSSAIASPGASTVTSGTTAETTSATEFWAGISGNQFSGTSVMTGPASPWTNESQLTSGPFNAICGWQFAASEGTANYTSTVTNTDNACGCVATFKLSALKVALSPMTVVQKMLPVTGLIVSMAPVSGTDALGNEYASGFTGPITNFVPGTAPAIVETWHTLSPPSGWTGTLRYKILSETNFAVVDCNLVTGTGTAGTIHLGTVTGDYMPKANLYRPIMTGTNGTNAAADMFIGSTGSLVAENHTTTGTIATIAATVMYPLD